MVAMKPSAPPIPWTIVSGISDKGILAAIATKMLAMMRVMKGCSRIADHDGRNTTASDENAEQITKSGAGDQLPLRQLSRCGCLGRVVSRVISG